MDHCLKPSTHVQEPLGESGQANGLTGQKQTFQAQVHYNDSSGHLH
jgi:hypothetical protein